MNVGLLILLLRTTQTGERRRPTSADGLWTMQCIRFSKFENATTRGSRASKAARGRKKQVHGVAAKRCATSGHRQAKQAMPAIQRNCRAPIAPVCHEAVERSLSSHSAASRCNGLAARWTKRTCKHILQRQPQQNLACRPHRPSRSVAPPEAAVRRTTENAVPEPSLLGEVRLHQVKTFPLAVTKK